MESIKLIFIITCVFSFHVFAGDEKIYSQNEFDQKLRKQVKRQIELIKKKSISELAKELSDKSISLEQKKIELDKKEELLKNQNEDFLKKVRDFESIKIGIIGCLEKNEEQKNNRINKVVEVISNMKPVKAAEILAVQESTISVNILSKLDPTKASKIFNLMDKEISARLQKQYLHMKK
jgi:flagellar motility protein MotE (MotC chaperone)